jgi:hypothetical protein
VELRGSLKARSALQGAMRHFDLAEVEGHAGDTLEDAVGRGQAAEVWGGL